MLSMVMQKQSKIYILCNFTLETSMKTVLHVADQFDAQFEQIMYTNYMYVHVHPGSCARRFCIVIPMYQRIETHL